MRTLSLFLIVCLTACAGGSKGGDQPAGQTLAILPTSLPSGTAATFYSVTLRAAGGTGNGYAWRVVGGALAPGLGGLPAGGPTATLSGTLGGAGAYPLMLELRDSSGATAVVAYTLTVTAGGGGGGSGATSLVNAPSARSGHTAVWTGTEMIVWGGFNFLGAHRTGGAYDPQTDSWRTLSTTGAPSTRFSHSAVWTGTEMIVWGGWDTQGVLATGGAYNPATDTWRALPTAGAPIARASHSATWTGSVMVLWGGQGVFTPPAPNAVDRVFADGFAYDPVANSWSTIAAGGPPGSRGHTAVWTGSAVVVWGGRDSFALTISTQNTGGAYDPVANGWTLTNTATAPSARTGHTAVWSGSAMIVWGGVTSLAPSWLQSGGRYRPGSDTWSATATVGAPRGRSNHTAVWTGIEMIVWGGGGNGGLLGDGGAYDPVANAWRALPAGFAPTRRSGHTAVWTGTSMIVWGGATEPADTYLATGAILTP